MTTRARICDCWAEAANHRLRQHLMRATLAGRNYAPDQTYELSKAGKVGPVSAQIAEIFQQHAELWAEDARTAHEQRLELDENATWRSCMGEAEDAVGRLLAGHRMRGAA
jgi:hypothetical protein